MPGFITHYLFGADAYKRMGDASLRRMVKENHGAFALGLQGPDLFFYYVPSYFIHEKNIGNVAHEQRTGEFFKNLMEGRMLFAKDAAQLAIADAYILGFLGHYTLDTVTHPYVYAFTHYCAGQEEPPGYFARHVYLETDIDSELLWLKKGLLPSEFPQASTVRLNSLEKKVLSRLIAYAYRQTYPDIRVTSSMISGAFFCLHTGRCLVNDKSGQKKVLVRFAEQKLFGHAMVSPMIPSDVYQFCPDALNYAHKDWVHPWTKTASRASFVELFEEAGRLYDNRISTYYDMVLHGFTNGKKKMFLSGYGSRSFTSGQSEELPNLS